MSLTRERLPALLTAIAEMLEPGQDVVVVLFDAMDSDTYRRFCMAATAGPGLQTPDEVAMSLFIGACVNLGLDPTRAITAATNAEAEAAFAEKLGQLGLFTFVDGRPVA